MSKTIWLTKLGVEMLNDETSPLAISFRYVEKVLNVNTSFLYLKEENEKIICIDHQVAVLLPLVNSELIKKVIERKENIVLNGYYGICLSSLQADNFGCLLVEGNIEWTNEMQEAVNAFSELIYANLMGGFLSSDKKTIMKVNDICLSYDEKNVDILKQVSLEIKEGELTIIMGKSGCGKSTLLNVMASLLKPKSGTILYNEKNIYQLNKRQRTLYRRDNIGFVFQNYNLINDLTVKENVEVASILSSSDKDVNAILELVGLQWYQDKYPNTLSGGEQQRVSIARALIKNAAILLCDEPTGALDSENSKNIMSLLQNIAKSRNVAVVIVTHNPDYAILADHYIKMKDGVIMEDYYCRFPYQASKVL